ncbi:hypothetical protein A9975_26070 [Cupriavidus sp. UME77]|nr:hypothetical protein [Cupriavidus sp. UME77]
MESQLGVPVIKHFNLLTCQSMVTRPRRLLAWKRDFHATWLQKSVLKKRKGSFQLRAITRIRSDYPINKWREKFRRFLIYLIKIH